MLSLGISEKPLAKGRPLVAAGHGALLKMPSRSTNTLDSENQNYTEKVVL
jgi:hypothetical protein